MGTTWSHSALKDFKTCPRKYHETKVLKLYPNEDTPQTIYGKQVHEQAEWYIRDGRPLDKSFEFMKPVLDSLIAMPGTKLCEHEMALTNALEPCDFNDENRWVRGIADLIILNEKEGTAKVIDYKTGSDKYPDPDQLTLMALMIFKHFPKIKSVSGALLFVLKGTMTKNKTLHEQEHVLWWRYREEVAKIDKALFHNVWQERPSGLCKRYCPCVTCPHNGRS